MFPVQKKLAELANYFVEGRLGNHHIAWDEYLMYALTRVILKEIQQKIDPQLKYFDAWYETKTSSKKRGEMGGRALLLSKYRGQIDKKVKQVSRIISNNSQ
jgi:hypothetical protein